MVGYVRTAQVIVAPAARHAIERAVFAQQQQQQHLHLHWTLKMQRQQRIAVTCQSCPAD